MAEIRTVTTLRGKRDEITRRQLALHVMKAKGLDAADKVLAKAISYRLIHVPRIQARKSVSRRWLVAFAP